MNGARCAVIIKPWLGVGGADRWSIDAALALRAAGWDATIWTNRHVRETTFPETLDGRVRVEVRAEAEALAGRFDRFRVWRVLRRQRALLRAMKQEGVNPQLVVCDVLPHVVPFARRLWPKSAVLCYCHYPDKLMAPAGGWIYRLYRGPLDWLERRGLAAADHVVVNSRFTATAVREAFPMLATRSLAVVYPGVVVPGGEIERRAGGWFLTVSRIDPRKGLPLVVAAFAAMKERVSSDEFAGCRLILAGGYDERLPEVRALLAGLRAQAEKAGVAAQVEFRLNVSTDDLEALWAGARALVHSMDGEHFGIVPVEAMARGLPVLAVNSGGPCETVMDGVTGALRPPEAEAFAAVMADWLRGPGAAGVLGAAGRVRARLLFSHERFAADMVAAADEAMKPVAVVSHPPFGVLGGGEVVAAWTVQALSDGYRVVLVGRAPVALEQIDRWSGTNLQAARIRRVAWPAWMRLFLKLWPGRGDRWQHVFQERILMRLSRRERVTVWVSTFNESRLPAPGVQYVHFPAGAVNQVYAWCLRLMAPSGMTGPAAHRTLVNSNFTAEKWGGDARVVYPPVPALTGRRPWAERAEFRMVCLGRLLPGKGIVRASRIVAAVRAQGIPMTLAVVGAWACSGRERRRMERELRASEGLEWHGELARAQLAALVAESRYGLLGMEEEPFGIAVAELQAAGCIVFAPEKGGPAEILDEPAQLYRDEADAVRKIIAVVRSPERQTELHERAKNRATLFSPECFMRRIRDEVSRSVAAR
ncbi:MAG: alpha,3/1,6-mannosyltransferase ALG2-like [Rariglobus sp.]|jgi:glycosyltransferase involved in cell wall biosynthesis|nr:alpha,3/1,6-mannosyltransferase ALG2-like [Rariglobus sp.]